MEHISYLMEYHRSLRVAKEKNYQIGVSSVALTEVMNSLSIEIRRLRWM